MADPNNVLPNYVKAKCASGDWDELYKLIATVADLSKTKTSLRQALYLTLLDTMILNQPIPIVILDMMAAAAAPLEPMVFCAANTAEHVDILARHFGDINQVDGLGFTAVLHAVRRRVSKVVIERLLQLGANPVFVDDDGLPGMADKMPYCTIAEVLAARIPDIEMLRLLLGYVPYKGQPNWMVLPLHVPSGDPRKSPTKRTFLHFVAKEGQDPRVTKILLEYGADANERDTLGRTALHFAAQFDRRDIMQVLLENGANVNITDAARRTPLWCVSARASAALLLKYGAAIDVAGFKVVARTSQVGAEIDRIVLLLIMRTPRILLRTRSSAVHPATAILSQLPSELLQMLAKLLFDTSL